MSTTTNFSSDGFDLDAMPDHQHQHQQQDGEQEQDVIYEVGGGVTSLPKQPKQPKQLKRDESAVVIDPAIVVTSEQYKAQGNDQFKQGAYLEAYDMYTDAIEACPGMKGSELLKKRDEFEEQQQTKAYEQFKQDDEERKRKLRQEQEEKRNEILNKGKGTSSSSTTNASSTTTTPSTPTTTPTEQQQQPKEQFKAPFHKYGDKYLSVYHCNRAACLLHLKRYEEAIVDCDVAILLKPHYVKAYLRRSTAYEQTERIDEALQDAKQALQYDPSNSIIQKNVMRLQKLHDKQLEELKEQTMSQLKDLGNSLLGNFGLSLDNFKAVQDPNTGSYSISFEQNK